MLHAITPATNVGELAVMPVATIEASTMQALVQHYDRSIAVVIDRSALFSLLKALTGDDSIDGNDRTALREIAAPVRRYLDTATRDDL